jgi:hypothetical protein
LLFSGLPLFSNMNSVSREIVEKISESHCNG